MGGRRAQRCRSAYNGYNGNGPGGGGAGCYSGSGETGTTNYWDGANHWYYYIFGLNYPQWGGLGASGGVWINAIDTSIPELLHFFAFYDAAAPGPATGLVAANETTSSLVWTDLATVTDQVTVNIGPSGMAIVLISADIANNAAGPTGYVGFALSGSNTVAPSYNYCISATNVAYGDFHTSGSFLLVGLDFRRDCV